MTRDAGETLAETLVTVAILGLTVTGVLGGIAALASTSGRHRGQATAETLLMGATEHVKAQGFTAGCAAPAAPSATAVPREAGWTITVSAPVDAVSGGACTGSTAVQRVTVRVTGPNHADRAVDVLLRDPA